MGLITLLAFCAINIPGYSSDADTQKEILRVMDVWKQAMIARDRGALESLYAADLSYCHSDGRHETKTAAIDAVVNGKERYESIALTDMSIRAYGSTALAQCKMTLNLGSAGETRTLVLDVLHVWVKNAGAWQLAARHSTRLNPS